MKKRITVGGSTHLVDNTAVDDLQKHAQYLLQYRGILHGILHLVRFQTGLELVLRARFNLYRVTIMLALMSLNIRLKDKI